MNDYEFMRKHYVIWIIAVVFFEWVAMKLTHSFVAELTYDSFIFIRVVTIAVGYIMLFLIVRKRLSVFNLPSVISYLCLAAFFFSPIFILFLKTKMVIPVVFEHIHFWMGIPIITAAILLVLGLLFKREKLENEKPDTHEKT
ncbi:MAG: hypothetical protein KJO81_06255 [Gammaproteobacteria bacterium]|nr:hypothetical protein [Gammaproteobacteria bacterium]